MFLLLLVAEYVDLVRCLGYAGDRNGRKGRRYRLEACRFVSMAFVGGYRGLTRPQL